MTLACSPSPRSLCYWSVLIALAAATFLSCPAQALDKTPETQEEIVEYKKALIDRYYKRLGNPQEKQPVTIDSLEELAEYSGRSNVHVKMKPGTYEVTLDNFEQFLTLDRSVHGYPTLFAFTGSKSYFDLRGVTVKIDTRILNAYAKALDIKAHKYGIEEVMVTGRNLIIRGLTIKDVHEIRPDQPEPEVKIVETDASEKPRYANFSFDGNPYSFASVGQGEGRWISYRLNQPTELRSVSARTRDGRSLSFQIQVARGDDDWHTVHEGKLTDEMTDYTFEPVTADRVRLVGDGDQRNWSTFAEVRIGDLTWPAAYPKGENYHPPRSTRTVKVDGKRCLFQGVSITSRGSRPYGYGRLLGKGRSLVPMNKHSTLASSGDDLAFVECEVYPRSYGHGWGWGSNNDITAIHCYIEGESRSTNAMLQETTGPLVDADYQNYWTKQRIQPGMMISHHEDTFRSYPHPYKPKGNQPGTVKLLGCTVKHMSSGTALAGSYKGDVFVSNMKTVGNTQRGYAVPSNARIVNSATDIRYGAALQMRPSSNIKADLTILPSPTHDKITRHRQPAQYAIREDTTSPPGGYVKLAAVIVGNDHEIALKARQDLKLDKPMPIVLGYARGDYKTAKNVDLKNTTGLPIILTRSTKNCHIRTNGKILRDDGENNTIESIE